MEQENIIRNFRRKEKKYILSAEKYELVKEHLGERFAPDAYGESTIGNLYFDTPDMRIIRASVDAVNYKEKLRLRAYNDASKDSIVFFEMKKKLDGFVYKRRIELTLGAAESFINDGIIPENSQIINEISSFISFYDNIAPRMYIAYDREPFFCVEDESLRLTFDKNIRYRTDDLRLDSSKNGKQIGKDTYVMEIKCDGHIPLWLSSFLDSLKIYPSRFSKYGTAYFDMLSEKVSE